MPELASMIAGCCTRYVNRQRKPTRPSQRPTGPDRTWKRTEQIRSLAKALHSDLKMKQSDLPKSAPAHPDQSAQNTMAESRIPQEDKAGAQREYQQGKGVRGQQGMVQEGSTAASAQVLTNSIIQNEMPQENSMCPCCCQCLAYNHVVLVINVESLE